MKNHIKPVITFIVIFSLLLTGAFSPAWSYVTGISNPGKWGDPAMGTPGGTVTWSLIPTGTTYYESSDRNRTFTSLGNLFGSLTGWKSEIEAAFDAWSSIANIHFIEVTDNGLPHDSPGGLGDIRMGAHSFDGSNGELAHGYTPPNNGVSAAGDVHFDTAEIWKIGFGGSGFDIFTVATHEIGHAIGLGHTSDTRALMYQYYSESFRGPQPDDIAGAQFIYGTAVVVPEPLSSSLFGIGTAMLFLRKRLKNF